MKLLREQPYVFEVHTDYAVRVCWNCLRFEHSETNSLHRCGRCRFARYCNATCQKVHFKEHKLQCCLLQKSAPLYPNAYTRLVAQLMLKDPLTSTKNPSANLAVKFDMDGATLPLEQHRSIEDLECYDDHGDTSYLAGFANEFFAKDVCRYLGTLGSKKEFQKAIKLFAQVKSNNTVVTQGSYDCLGLGIYLDFSAVPHSCNPNCSTAFLGKDLILYSLTPEDGSLCWDKNAAKKLTVTYINDIFDSKENRQKVLMENYSYSCQCLACVGDDPDREADLASVLCTSCNEVLAKPVGPVMFKPFDFFENHGMDVVAAAISQASQIKFKCTNAECNGTFSLRTYATDLENLALLIKSISALVMASFDLSGSQKGLVAAAKLSSTQIDAMLSIYLELRMTIFPEFSVGRYRLIPTLIDVIGKKTADYPLFLKQCYGDMIKFLHHYLRPGHAVTVVEYANMARCYLSVTERMFATTECLWRDEKLKECVTEGLASCKEHVAIMESIYSLDHPVYNYLKNTVDVLIQHKETIDVANAIAEAAT